MKRLIPVLLLAVCVGCSARTNTKTGEVELRFGDASNPANTITSEAWVAPGKTKGQYPWSSEATAAYDAGETSWNRWLRGELSESNRRAKPGTLVDPYATLKARAEAGFAEVGQ